MTKPRAPYGAAQKFVRAAATHTDPVECLEWPYNFDENGYGILPWEGRRTRAHRAVLLVVTGMDRDTKLEAAHAPVVCHNRSCVNPHHLRWATRTENQRDRRDDGTANLWMAGEGNNNAVLTEDQVRAILADVRPGCEIAASYGVSPSAVSSIKRGRSWQSILPDDYVRPPGKTKLTAEQVRAIRADPRPNSAVGVQYGIAPSHVSDIKNRKAWAHLAD